MFKYKTSTPEGSERTTYKLLITTAPSDDVITINSTQEIAELII